MELSSPPLLSVRGNNLVPEDMANLNHSGPFSSHTAAPASPSRTANFVDLLLEDGMDGSPSGLDLIHGPALPGDCTGQIYNDWDGELSMLDDYMMAV